MDTKRVKEIVVPYQEGLTLSPSVCLSDKVSEVLKIMLKHNLNRIIVIHHERPIGMVRIEDALSCLGVTGGSVS